MTKRTKAILINMFFHFVVLGLVVRPLFYPDMINEYWLILIIMVFLMNPIVNYFYGWEMHLRGCVPADAPKLQRLSLLLLLMVVYAFAFLKWLGVIGQVIPSS